MYFDRFDIAEAWHVYSMAYHGGQGSKLYRVQGRLSLLKFYPRIGLYDREGLTENGREIYDRLVRDRVGLD